MKNKKLITLSILILFGICAMAQDKYIEWAKEFSKKSIAENEKGYDFHGLIVKQANEKWKTDYVMVNHVIKNQCKALYEYTYMRIPDGMTLNTFKKIRLNAVSGWVEHDKITHRINKVDFEMILYETQKQVSAYLEIF